MPYLGRFAPSPTGPLHFGSLLAAVASFADTRAHSGRWLVRMEDLDRPRCIPGADSLILTALERYGFTWDAPVLYQSTRDPAYREALAALGPAAFPCSCTRRDICRCQLHPPAPEAIRSWRLAPPAHPLSFTDRLQGPFSATPDPFLLLRADGLFAYNLAVVVDDAFQGVTDVVRGADLLDSTPRHLWLQSLLGLPHPRYAHIPLAYGPTGTKLSKQTQAPALPLDLPGPTLARAFATLGYPPPPDLAAAPPAELWPWFLSQCQGL